MGFKIVLPNDRAYFSKLRAGRSLRRNLSIATASLVLSLLILLLGNCLPFSALTLTEYPVWSRFRGASLPSTQRRTAIVSNLQNDLYVANALILGYTIQKHNPNMIREGTDLILLVPNKNDITYNNMMRLQKLWTIRYEDDIEVKGSERLLVHHRRNYIKLRIWSWVNYTKIAWIDADCMVMGDISLLLSDKFGEYQFLSPCPYKSTDVRFRRRAGYISVENAGGEFQCRRSLNQTVPPNIRFPHQRNQNLSRGGWRRANTVKSPFSAS